MIKDIYYFSALASHLEHNKPEVTARHKLYLECLKDTGVSVELHRFKKVPITCKLCEQRFNRREEKETDVAIASRMFELLISDRCDALVLVTGDTDLVPAVKTAQRIFPTKELIFLMPYKRHNNELAKLVERHFDISSKVYPRHQFNDPYETRSGKLLSKPTSW